LHFACKNAKRRGAKNFNEGKIYRERLRKFRSSLYTGLSRAADETAVARARAKSHFGVFFLIAFSFAPFESKEKADNN
jgi:hypothetical protein